MVAALSKTGPRLPVDKNTGGIQLNSSQFDHYMDMVPAVALQFDGLSADGDAQCREEVLRYCLMNPRISDDRVPRMERTKASPVDRLLYQVNDMANNLTDV